MPYTHLTSHEPNLKESVGADKSDMKKNFLRFALQIMLLIGTTAAFVFCVVTFFVNEQFGWSQDAVTMLQSVVSVCLIVGVMSLAIGLPSFLVNIDSSGIKKGLLSNTLSWSDMGHAKIVGVPSIKYFNKLILSGRGQTVEINLFVFENQEKFVEDVRIFLPWETDLDVNNLPSEASKV